MECEEIVALISRLPSAQVLRFPQADKSTIHTMKPAGWLAEITGTRYSYNVAGVRFAALRKLPAPHSHDQKESERYVHIPGAHRQDGCS
jgi:hypothetical protein